MKTIKVTTAQQRVLQRLTRKDFAALGKYPAIAGEARRVLRAFRKIIKRINDISEHASRRKRQTAYKRIVTICETTIDRIDRKNVKVRG